MRIPIFLLIACWAGAARAQTRDTGARIERVTDGVYAIIHENATEEWPHGNTGVVVGPEDVLVVDAAYLPSRAKADVALIRSVTTKPVRWLVMSHWHFDHNNGNSAYREAYPGVTIVSERDTRGWIELNSTWWSRMTTAPGSAKRVALDKLEEQLRTGTDSSGRRLSAEERKALQENVDPPAERAGGAGIAQGRAAQSRLRSRAHALARQPPGRASGPGSGQQSERRHDLPARRPRALHR